MQKSALESAWSGIPTERWGRVSILPSHLQISFSGAEPSGVLREVVVDGGWWRFPTRPGQAGAAGS